MDWALKIVIVVCAVCGVWFIVLQIINVWKTVKPKMSAWASKEKTAAQGLLKHTDLAPLASDIAALKTRIETLEAKAGVTAPIIGV